jgi:Uma2 family endonuclease
MTVAAPHSRLRLTVAMFRPFLESRPDEEHWELVDGVPLMSPAPRIAHQRIASNLERLLHAALARAGIAWRPDREIGIEVSDDSLYRPEPEITLIDKGLDPDQNYAERFYGVFEVLSERDKGRNMALKVQFYKDHLSNRIVLVMRQDIAHIELHERSEAGAWSSRTLTDLDDKLVLDPIGEIGTLLEIYEDTKVDPRFAVLRVAKPRP